MSALLSLVLLKRQRDAFAQASRRPRRAPSRGEVGPPPGWTRASSTARRGLRADA
jgi:hypothetical protein